MATSPLPSRGPHIVGRVQYAGKWVKMVENGQAKKGDNANVPHPKCIGS